MRPMTHPIVVTDMDGTLAEAETWRGILAWLAANHPSREASRFVTVRLPRLAFAKVFRRSKEAFRARWMEDQARLLAGLSAVMMPFMVLSVWAALQRLDPQIENAAMSLGAGPVTIIRRIIMPQIMPGVLSGAIIVFSLSASAFATPAIIGGRRLKVAATLAYDEFLNTLNWPLGAAVASLLLLALVLITVGSNRLIERRYAQVFE